MTIPYLPGWGDELAKNLPQIGQNLTNIFNPNQKFEELFKASIAKDPTLLQSIANNPGLAESLGKMGLGNVGQSTAGLQIDPTVAANRTIAGSNARVAQATETPTIDAAKANARVAVETAPTKIESAKTDAARGKLDYNVLKQKFDLDLQTLKDIPTLAGVDISGLVARTYANKLTPEDNAQLARMAMDPGASTAYSSALKGLQERAEIASRWNIAKLHAEIQREQKNEGASQLPFLVLNQLNKQSDDLIGQLDQARKIYNSIAPDKITQLKMTLGSKDKNISAAAKETIDAWESAKKIVTSTEPGSFNAQLAELNSKRNLITQIVEKQLGMGVQQTPAPNNVTKLSDSDINQYRAALKSGKIQASQLQGKISEEDYNKIVGKANKPIVISGKK